MLPWTNTALPSSMQTSEFVEWLRYNAIAFGAATGMIDQIENLASLSSLEEVNEKLRADLEVAGDDMDELKSSLRSALEDYEEVKNVKKLLASLKALV